MRVPLIALAFVLCGPILVVAQDCDQAPTGLIPLTELGNQRYRGFPGGLYPKRSNGIPSAHSKLGLKLAKSLTPLDKAGKPSAKGKIVLLSIGMSNTAQEFNHFQRLVEMDFQHNDALVLVDGAIGGYDASRGAISKKSYWALVQQRLNKAGVTAAQVQIFWLKEAVISPTKPFPLHAQALRDLLAKTVQDLHIKFPQGKLCFVSSRIYAGYATKKLNAEPFAYESGFAVKWLIERQIQGDKSLNPDSKSGKVKAPWLCWGPYLWADGLKKRQDGLRWWCDEFTADGTHPSDAGRWKVADRLFQHFRNHPIARPWYYGGTKKPRANVILYGDACRGRTGAPKTQVFGSPKVGNQQFAIGESNIPANSIAVALVTNGRDFGMFGKKCDLLVDLSKIVFFHPIVTSSKGTVHMFIPVPNHPSMLGAELFCQWFNLDSGGTAISIGGVSLSRGIHLLVGQ